MREQFLTIDIYDADTKFLFATAKLPMFELLRQQMSHVVRAKEVEASAPDSAEWRASIQIIMSNQGKQDKTTLKLIETGGNTAPMSDLNGRTRLGQQPSQQMQMRTRKYQKIVKSQPMDLSRISQQADPMKEMQHNTVNSLGQTGHHSLTGA